MRRSYAWGAVAACMPVTPRGALTRKAACVLPKALLAAPDNLPLDSTIARVRLHMFAANHFSVMCSCRSQFRDHRCCEFCVTRHIQHQLYSAPLSIIAAVTETSAEVVCDVRRMVFRLLMQIFARALTGLPTFTKSSNDVSHAF